MLDIEKVRAASMADFCALALCEFSRFVDAIERIAPDTNDAASAPAITTAGAPSCPHPDELRINESTMGQEPFSTFRCGVCGERVITEPVEA